MEDQKNDLPQNGTKRELYDRLKTTMQKESQAGAVGGTRRGFLGTLLTGGVAVLGFGTVAVIGQSAMAGCSGCENPEIGCGQCYCNCEQDCEAGCLNDCQVPCQPASPIACAPSLFEPCGQAK